MKENDAHPEGQRPQFFDERGVPESVTPPDQMVGIYRFSRDENVPDPNREYTRQGVLTSEGWVPPVSKILVHTVANTGGGANDLSVIGNYTAGKATRIALDPRELRSQLGDHGSIAADDVTPVYGTRYSESVEIYIPDALDSEEIAEYLRDCVRPATRHYLDEHDGEQPTPDQIASILVDAYEIDHQTALRAVEIATDE